MTLGRSVYSWVMYSWVMYSWILVNAGYWSMLDTGQCWLMPVMAGYGRLCQTWPVMSVMAGYVSHVWFSLVNVWFSLVNVWFSLVDHG